MNRFIAILTKGEFVEVILPWVKELTKTISLDLVGDVLECMLNLL